MWEVPLWLWRWRCPHVRGVHHMMVPMWGGTDVKTGNSLWVNLVMAWLSYYVIPKGDEYIQSIIEKTNTSYLSSTHIIKSKSLVIAYCKNVPAITQAHTMNRHLVTNVQISGQSRTKQKYPQVPTREHVFLEDDPPHTGEHLKMRKHGRDWVMNRCLVAHTSGHYHTISRFAILYESNVMQQFQFHHFFEIICTMLLKVQL